MRALAGESSKVPPLWMMRQAGRYLPEYRALRATASGFLDFCYRPELAVEATLQPIRRFGFDAAILFSDILVIPDALGQRVSFVEGEGPRLEPITDGAALARLGEADDLTKLTPVLETVERVRGSLGAETGFIGFCGAPWTVASYMIAGKGTPDQAPIREMAYADPDLLQAMIDKVTQASITYLTAQVDAGVDAVQIFESFGGALPPALFARWSFQPIMRIVDGLKAARPAVKVIVFARGAGLNLARFAAEPNVAAVGLDWSVDTAWAARTLQPLATTQGNLDPLALIAGGAALEQAVDLIKADLGAGPHIFNLGHGIQPHTPIAHVEQLVKRVRAA